MPLNSTLSPRTPGHPTSPPGSFRPVRLLCAAVAFLLGGCSVLVAGTMTLANGLDQSTTQSTVSALRAEQVRDIKALQAAGDPMGDYFFALANAEGWIGEGRVADPLVIMDMYKIGRAHV